MSTERGNLSINSENIFPIIKKWLYSDHDIFVRELISNGCDAITKLKKLEIMGEVDIPEDTHYKVVVTINPEEKTICFSDNGVGMTAEEVKEYINQIAFSGAKKFIETYKDKASDDQIIGHFGLGFYSAFMVADKVTINTLSWQKDAAPVYWESEGGLEYEMREGSRSERGTDITLHLNEDSYEFSNEYRVKEVINKYCSFMPVEIYFENANAPKEKEKDKDKDKDKKAEDEAPKPLNDTTPLWTKHPNDCTEEEYKKFYREVFHDYKEPLFWIHLNMDYPFNLKGILYFPKINTEYDSIEGVIKLYSNQVFIADNIKEVTPEFLMLLKGVIDCPDLPLNVSRSALQNDGFVRKISDYITKKVADKLSGMYKVERENYEKFWDDISPFIKFGCLKDDKFSDKMKDFIIYKNLEGKYITLDDYIEAAKSKSFDDKKEEDKSTDEGKEKTDSSSTEDDQELKEDEKVTVYYITDEKQQSQYINMFKEAGLDAVYLTHNIDQPFITHVEYKNQKVRFMRIDADITDSFRDETKKKDKKLLKNNTEAMTKLFRKVLGKEKLEVKVEKLKNDKVSSVITLSEESRRMQDMMRMYNMGAMDDSMFAGGETLVLNANHKLVQYIIANENSEHTPMICEQLYDLAYLSHKPLEPEAMTRFIQRSNEIMLLLAQ
ncbi:molecular chaperone HtpG [Herbinix luporum]|jgi:molecular chaperone HtpG|uniref:molecular chaperone HtpG n=1 Tax=Herbinix luporum TaxID=1679721 RepID=UPI00175B61F7|nr:molecular chaperone HtpG [Herbinix luporum]HHT56192.1 molecular chaperone HtpG [Herbinix luporum]